MFKVHIRPKWGNYPISEVKPSVVEEWLRCRDLEPEDKGASEGHDAPAL